MVWTGGHQRLAHEVADVGRGAGAPACPLLRDSYRADRMRRDRSCALPASSLCRTSVARGHGRGYRSTSWPAQHAATWHRTARADNTTSSPSHSTFRFHVCYFCSEKTVVLSSMYITCSFPFQNQNQKQTFCTPVASARPLDSFARIPHHEEWSCRTHALRQTFLRLPHLI